MEYSYFKQLLRFLHQLHFAFFAIITEYKIKVQNKSECLTFDDLREESGMSSKEVWRKIRKEKLVIYLDRKEVQNTLLKNKNYNA